METAKTLLLTVIGVFLLTSLNVSAVTTNVQDLGTIRVSPGGYSTKVIRLTIGANESVTLTSNSSFISFSQSFFSEQNESYNASVTVTIAVPEGTDSGTYPFKITMDGLTDAEVEGVVEVPEPGVMIPSISYIGKACPGRTVFLQVTAPNKKYLSGKVAAVDSRGNAVGLIDIDRGYGLLSIPKDERDYVLVKFSEPEGTYEVATTLIQISEECGVFANEGPETKEMHIRFTQTEFELSDDGVEIQGIVMLDGERVSGADVIITGPEIQTKETISGLFSFKPSHEGNYTCWAEKKVKTIYETYNLRTPDYTLNVIKPLQKVEIYLKGTPKLGEDISFVIKDDNKNLIKFDGKGTIKIGDEDYEIKFEGGKSEDFEVPITGNAVLKVSNENFEGGAASMEFVVPEVKKTVIPAAAILIFLIFGVVIISIAYVAGGFIRGRIGKSKPQWHVVPTTGKEYVKQERVE